jgi:hypothetical protein
MSRYGRFRALIALPPLAAAVAAAVIFTGPAHAPPGLAMARPQADASLSAVHLDTGIPHTGAARQTTGHLHARRVVARRAEAARDRREARRAARRAARQAAELAAQSNAQGGAGGAAGAAQEPSGSPQQIALNMLGQFGWPESQFGCLDALWNTESGWDVTAENPSGAYGIPQALPGSKMASAGSDWQTNPATQIKWGLGYIASVYGSPCGAEAHEEADGYY